MPWLSLNQFILKADIQDKGTDTGKPGYSFILTAEYKMAC